MKEEIELMISIVSQFKSKTAKIISHLINPGRGFSENIEKHCHEISILFKEANRQQFSGFLMNVMPEVTYIHQVAYNRLNSKEEEKLIKAIMPTLVRCLPVGNIDIVNNYASVSEELSLLAMNSYLKYGDFFKYVEAKGNDISFPLAKLNRQESFIVFIDAMNNALKYFGESVDIRFRVAQHIATFINTLHDDSDYSEKKLVEASFLRLKELEDKYATILNGCFYNGTDVCYLSGLALFTEGMIKMADSILSNHRYLDSMMNMSPVKSGSNILVNLSRIGYDKTDDVCKEIIRQRNLCSNSTINHLRIRDMSLIKYFLFVENGNIDINDIVDGKRKHHLASSFADSLDFANGGKSIINPLADKKKAVALAERIISKSPDSAKMLISYEWLMPLLKNINACKRALICRDMDM